MNGAPIDSPEQAAVIQAPLGENVLVVAGAGSGKTYTMTRRIVSLIERGVPPESILGLTFTRKAASELGARVSAAVLDGHDRIHLRRLLPIHRASIRSARRVRPERAAAERGRCDAIGQYGARRAYG